MANEFNVGDRVRFKAIQDDGEPVLSHETRGKVRSCSAGMVTVDWDAPGNTYGHGMVPDGKGKDATLCYVWRLELAEPAEIIPTPKPTAVFQVGNRVRFKAEQEDHQHVLSTTTLGTVTGHGFKDLVVVKWDEPNVHWSTVELVPELTGSYYSHRLELAEPELPFKVGDHVKTIPERGYDYIHGIVDKIDPDDGLPFRVEWDQEQPIPDDVEGPIESPDEVSDLAHQSSWWYDEDWLQPWDQAPVPKPEDQPVAKKFKVGDYVKIIPTIGDTTIRGQVTSTSPSGSPLVKWEQLQSWDADHKGSKSTVLYHPLAHLEPWSVPVPIGDTVEEKAAALVRCVFEGLTPFSADLDAKFGYPEGKALMPVVRSLFGRAKDQLVGKSLLAYNFPICDNALKAVTTLGERLAPQSFERSHLYSEAYELATKHA